MTLPEVDEVRVTTMVDNTFDVLLPLPKASPGRRWAPGGPPRGNSPAAGLRAEQGFSVLVTVQRGNAGSTLLFDAGASPDGLAVNAERFGIDVGGLQGVVLSY
ncbi:hypothetical protein [Streptomyces lydicus]|uniref:hypothetical protein n=1 Tax=Streptomyces lydicus TaxID=47763 RepID=UPI00343A070A